MTKRLIALSIIGSLTLAACSPKDEQKPETLACNDPAVAQTLQQQLQQAIGQSARQFAQTDNRQFVDADKIIAAASQLSVVLTNAQSDTASGKPACSAQLDVSINQAIWQQAEANTPILYPQQQLLPLLQGQLMGSQVHMNGNTFSQPLRYLPAEQNASAVQSTWVIEAPGIAQLGHILTNALMPYGVKDTLIINGQAYSRADALKIINNPQAVVPELSPEAAMASAILNAGALPADQTPAPVLDETPTATVPANALLQAQSDNRQANNTINNLWRNLDDMVRSELQAEQKQWVAKKTNQCGHAAEKNATSAADSEYRYLQCDTQMTNERINYLRGFSLP